MNFGESFPVLFASLCGGFFFLLTFALGLYLVIFNQKARKKADSSQGWPSTPGTVTVSQVKKSISHDDDGNESVAYYPHVEYTYQVADRQYSSKRLSFGAQIAKSNPGTAETTLLKYPVGGQVTVFYDPQNPSDAVLVRQAGGFKTGMTIGIILLVISLCIACVIIYSLVGQLGNIF